jgi:hypothetical protein
MHPIIYSTLVTSDFVSSSVINFDDIIIITPKKLQTMATDSNLESFSPRMSHPTKLAQKGVVVCIVYITPRGSSFSALINRVRHVVPAIDLNRRAC